MTAPYANANAPHIGVTPINCMTFSATSGSPVWTNTYTGNVEFKLKTASTSTTTVRIPLMLPRRSDSYGVKLQTIILPVRITTANLTVVPTATLYRVDYDAVNANADGDVAAVTVASTNDGSLTLDANDRRLTVTVTSPANDLSTEALCDYRLDVLLNEAATTVARVYAAFTTYTILS